MAEFSRNRNEQKTFNLDIAPNNLPASSNIFIYIYIYIHIYIIYIYIERESNITIS